MNLRYNLRYISKDYANKSSLSLLLIFLDILTAVHILRKIKSSSGSDRLYRKICTLDLRPARVCCKNIKTCSDRSNCLMLDKLHFGIDVVNLASARNIHLTLFSRNYIYWKWLLFYRSRWHFYIGMYGQRIFSYRPVPDLPCNFFDGPARWKIILVLLVRLSGPFRLPAGSANYGPLSYL